MDRTYHGLPISQVDDEQRCTPSRRYTHAYKLAVPRGIGMSHTYVCTPIYPNIQSIVPRALQPKLANSARQQPRLVHPRL